MGEGEDGEKTVIRKRSQGNKRKERGSRRR